MSMSSLQNNQEFMFICQILHWDDIYAEHVASDYSVYSDVDTAILALCKDYGLDYNSIHERNYISKKPDADITFAFINDQVRASIISLIRKSTSPDIVYYTKYCTDASCYFMRNITDTKFDLCYKDRINNREIVIGRLELTLDCMSRTNKPNTIRKRDDRYYGNVVNTEEDVVIRFLLHLKHNKSSKYNRGSAR